MKRFICLLLLCLALHVYAERVEPYSGSRIFWDVSSRTVPFQKGGYSRLIRLQDGRLLIVADQGGKVIGSFSNDLGVTWEPQFTIATPHNNIDERVPDLIQLTDGTIIVAYNPRPKKPYTEDRKFGIRCKRSTDNGATWGEEIFVDDATHDFYNGAWEPIMLELPSGELQLYYSDEEPYPSVGYGDQQISLCRSFDSGQTWSKPQKIIYRVGYRDGMPSPIISSDGKEIIVSIEDNGWGYGDFFPTIIRCPLSLNWGNDYFVDADSPNREWALDLNYCPAITGGAPYICKLADGETVLSWQSKYDSSVNKMWVAVGNEEARNFKALTKPFITAASERIEWNSVTVIDTIVYAVGGVNGKIEVEKGYPKKQFEASLGTPTIDGIITENEGYYTPHGTQVHLGGQTGTIALCDFAYDRDSLYFCCCVNDTNQIKNGAKEDAVILYVDAANTSDTYPIEGVFRYMFRLKEWIVRYYGSSAGWRLSIPSGPRCVVRQLDTYYVVEAAIPWTDMELSAPPSHRMAVNIEVQNGSDSSMVTESIPDANGRAPYTWMTLHLQK